MSLWLQEGRLNCRATREPPSDDLLRRLKERREALIGYFEARESGPPSTAPSFPAIPRDTPIPVPDYLARFWTAVKSGRHGIGYTNGTSFAVWLASELDENHFRTALTHLMARHHVLSARHEMVEGRDCFICDVSPNTVIACIDVRRVSEASVEEHLKPDLAEFFWRPFEVDKAMFRALLVKLPSGATGVGFVIHHFLVDDISVATLASELAQLYVAKSSGRSVELSEPPLQYTSYLAGMDSWIKAGGPDEHINFWLERLADAPATHLRRDGELDLASPQDTVSNHLFISADDAAALESVCAQNRATLFMGLVALAKMALRRCANQADITVRIAVDGRMGSVPLNAVGRHTNLVMLRTQIDPETNFEETLLEVRLAYIESLPHWICPYEVLHPHLAPLSAATDSPLISYRDFTPLERDTSINALLGDVRRYDTSAGPGGPAPTRQTNGQNSPNFEFVFRRGMDGLFLRFSYLPGLHDESRMNEFGQSFLELVRNAIRQ